MKDRTSLAAAAFRLFPPEGTKVISGGGPHAPTAEIDNLSSALRSFFISRSLVSSTVTFKCIDRWLVLFVSPRFTRVGHFELQPERHLRTRKSVSIKQWTFISDIRFTSENVYGVVLISAREAEKGN